MIISTFYILEMVQDKLYQESSPSPTCLGGSKGQSFTVSRKHEPELQHGARHMSLAHMSSQIRIKWFINTEATKDECDIRKGNKLKTNTTGEVEEMDCD